MSSKASAASITALKGWHFRTHDTLRAAPNVIIGAGFGSDHTVCERMWSGHLRLPTYDDKQTPGWA